MFWRPPLRIPHPLPIIIEVIMPSDLLKDPKEWDIVKEMGAPLTEPFKHKMISITNTPTGDPSELVERTHYPQSFPEPEPPDGGPFSALDPVHEPGDVQSLWSQIAPGLEKVINFAYDVAAEPVRASGRLMERFRPQKLPQDMTELERRQRLRAGPPTLGRAVGAVSEAATDVASLIPGTAQETAIPKAFGKSLPVLLGTVPGIRRAIVKGEAGEVSKKGTPIIDNILNWAKEQYKGKLWTEPTSGFPRSGAQGKFIILKGQAPDTGIKIGNLESEMRFLQYLDKDMDKAQKLYNSNTVLQDYLPEMITRPQLGGRLMFVEQMKPMAWHEIRNLPLSEQRTMFANMAKHMRRIDKEFEKLGIEFFDDSTGNWGLTREGKPQIMDIGGMGGLWGAEPETGKRLLERATFYFDEAAYPTGNLDAAAEFADKMKKGILSEQELSMPEFWVNMEKKHGKELFGERQVIPPKKFGTTDVVPDPGSVSKEWQKKADELLASVEREAPPAGKSTQAHSVSHLQRRLAMYESLEEAWQTRNPGESPLWVNDIKKIRAELARRQGKTPSPPPRTDTPLDPSNIAAWPIRKLQGRLEAARTIAKDPEMATIIQPRIDQLEKEIARRGSGSPRDIVKEMSR